MKLEHVAIWTNDLEALKEYYTENFDGRSGEKYYNSQNEFESYFLSFKSGARLELMRMPGIPNNQNDTVKNQHAGLIHLAFEADSRHEVNKKAEIFRSKGLPILSGPRITGDGYYEFETLDPENNRIEVTFRDTPLAQ